MIQNNTSVQSAGFSAVPNEVYSFPNGIQSPEHDAFKSVQTAGVRQSHMNTLYGGKKSNNKLFKKTYKSRKHKSRKHKSRKHKSRKHKSRKHKSRKHKSRKHKSRKHKNNLKGGNNNGNDDIIVPTFHQSGSAISPVGDYTYKSRVLNSLYNQTLANSGGDNVTLNGGGRQVNY